jgi:RNA polymerase sigma-70 factor (ECF subfamily)
LAQETLTRAWSAWSTGKVPHDPRAWLATICLNAGRDRSRRAATRPRLVPLEPAGEIVATTDVAGEAITRVQRAQVEKALWELPEEQRIAITLMDLCALTAGEVAKVTGAPRGTVLARVHRGRTRLAGLLNPKPAEADEEVHGQ